MRCRRVSLYIQWMALICDSEDIEPEDTRVHVRAITRETGEARDLATTSLAEWFVKARAIIAKTAPADGAKGQDAAEDGSRDGEAGSAGTASKSPHPGATQ